MKNAVKLWNLTAVSNFTVMYRSFYRSWVYKNYFTSFIFYGFWHNVIRVTERKITHQPLAFPLNAAKTFNCFFPLAMKLPFAVIHFVRKVSLVLLCDLNFRRSRVLTFFTAWAKFEGPCWIKLITVGRTSLQVKAS